MTNTKGTPGKELVATSAPRGKIDATRTEYRHSPIDEGIRLEGSQPEPNQSVRGVLIDFPSNASLGSHDLPQSIPHKYLVSYFERTKVTTSYPVKKGKLTLLTLDLIEGSASGKFVGIVEVDGKDYELKGHFDIKKNA